MKKLLIVLMVFALSCSKDDVDELTGTSWVNDNIELSFYPDEGVNYKESGVLLWSGVYKLYKSGSIHIYRAKAGSSDWPIEYTGFIDGTSMELTDGDGNSLSFNQK